MSVVGSDWQAISQSSSFHSSSSCVKLATVGDEVSEEAEEIVTSELAIGENGLEVDIGGDVLIFCSSSFLKI